jgi:signal transduction histidine kinase
MDSMRSRAAELKGRIDWTPGTQGGTKIVLRFPLPESEA